MCSHAIHPFVKNVILSVGVAAACIAGVPASWADTIVSKDTFKPAWLSGWQVVASEPSVPSWLRIGTEGKGHPVFMTTEIEPTDLRKKVISFRCRISSLDNIGGFELRISDNKNFTEYLSFRITLFTDKNFNSLQGNTWHSFSFGLGNAVLVGSPNVKELKYLGIYVVDNAKAPLVFDFSGVVISEAKYKGMVSYTFDDGYDDIFNVAAPIMKKYHQTGTVYVIPSAVGKPDYMTLEQLKSLQAEGWAVSAHHKTAFTDFAPSQLKSEVDKLVSFFNKNGFSSSMPHLAYPLGKQNRTYVLPIVRKTFESARLAGGGMETLPPADPWLLRAFNVLSTTTVEELSMEVQAAKENHQWLILMFHYIVDTPSNDLEYDAVKFQKVVEMINNAGIPVAPVRKVLQTLTGN